MTDENHATAFSAEQVQGDVGAADDRKGEVDQLVAALFPVLSLTWRGSRDRYDDAVGGGRGIIQPALQRAGTAGSVQKYAVRTRRI